MPQSAALAQTWVSVRPEEVKISRDTIANGLQGTVVERLTLAPRNEVLLTIQVGEQEVHARTTGNGGHQVDDQGWLTFSRYHVFDKASGLRLRSYPPEPI